jgi:hypothetical protein
MPSKVFRIFFLAAALFLFPVNNPVSAQNLQWVRAIRSNQNLEVADVVYGQNASVYVLFNFNGTVDIDPGAPVLNVTSNGGSDFCLAHFLASGTLNWVKSFGGAGDDFARAIAIDPNNTLFITGSFSNNFDLDPGPGPGFINSIGSTDAFIARYDANGNYLFGRSFGNIYADEALDVLVTNSGLVILSGYFQGTVDFDPGSGQNYLGTVNGLMDMFITAFDLALNHQWVKGFGGTGIIRGVRLDCDNQDRIYTAGYFTGLIDFDPSQVPLFLPAGGLSAFILKLEPNGSLLDLGLFNAQAQCFPLDMVVTDTGSVSICGRFNGSVDFHPDTAQQFILQGSAQGDDGFYMMLDANLDPLWYRTIASPFADAVYSTGILSNGDIIYSGYFRGVYDFLDGPQYSIAGNQDESRAFILRLRPDGSLRSIKDYGSDATQPSCLALNPADLLVIAGNFSGPTNMQPDTGSFTINGSSINNVFLSRYSFCSSLELPDSLNGDTTLCSGSQSVFSASGLTNPVWTFPDGFSFFTQDSSALATPGNHDGYVQVAASNTCGIGPALALPISVNAIETTIQNTGGALWSLNYQASYQWVDCNNAYQPLAGETWQLFWPPAAGSYAVILQQDGCADTSFCEDILITALADLHDETSFFFPNPAATSTRVHLSKKVLSLQAFHPALGEVPVSYVRREDDLELNLSALPAGCYFIRITCTDHSVQTYRLLKS